MIDLILACAPAVAPVTIQEVIRVESGGNPIAVNVNVKNGKTFKYKKPTTKKQAIAVANSAINSGHTVDMGYMQINSANLKTLGYTVPEMFNPCKNLKAGAHILTTNYLEALPRYRDKQTALRAALSRYNTGSFRRGFENGYVNRYLDNVPTQRPPFRTLDPYTAETEVSWNQPYKVIKEFR